MTLNTECKMDLIIDMLLTLCGRNLEISFKETQVFIDRALTLGVKC